MNIFRKLEDFGVKNYQLVGCSDLCRGCPANPDRDFLGKTGNLEEANAVRVVRGSLLNP